MTILALAALALGVAAPAITLHYLHRLPYAPACPYCREVTQPGSGATVVDRAWARIAATAVRRCGRCGWSGRMRWRLAPGRTRADGPVR